MNERQRILEKRIKTHRRAFFVQISLFVLLSVLSLIGLILWSNVLWFFIIGTSVLVTSLLRIIFVIKSKTVSLFGMHREGVIIDKKEKVRILDKKLVGGFGSFSELRPYEHDRTEAIVGTVFIKESNGNVFSVGNLSEDQSAFFEIGDVVVLFAGAKFPLVINEPASRQKWLCPVCGTVSPDGTDCHVCGLPFSE